MYDQKDGGQRPDHETSGVQRGFQLPGWIWAAMVGCYAIFFAFILLATGGDGRALFAIGVSVLFAVMFFATAAVLASIKGRELPSPLSRGQDLQTLTGPMGLPAVVGQVLAIPVALVIFSIAIALITWGVR